MSTRNERFNKGMKSLDAMCEGMDISKWPAVSDGGAGARRVRNEVEKRGGGGERTKERLLMAERCLVEAGKEHLIDVLRLIVKYNGDRQQILEEVPRATYFRHRDTLLRFFVPQQRDESVPQGLERDKRDIPSGRCRPS